MEGGFGLGEGVVAAGEEGAGVVGSGEGADFGGEGAAVKVVVIGGDVDVGEVEEAELF